MIAIPRPARGTARRRCVPARARRARAAPRKDGRRLAQIAAAREHARLRVAGGASAKAPRSGSRPLCAGTISGSTSRSGVAARSGAASAPGATARHAPAFGWQRADDGLDLSIGIAPGRSSGGPARGATIVDSRPYSAGRRRESGRRGRPSRAHVLGPRRAQPPNGSRWARPAGARAPRAARARPDAPACEPRRSANPSGHQIAVLADRFGSTSVSGPGQKRSISAEPLRRHDRRHACEHRLVEHVNDQRIERRAPL